MNRVQRIHATPRQSLQTKGNLPYLPRLGARQWVEALCAALAAGLLYLSLYGELPYHDVSRFVNQVNSDRFVWDIGHIFMQPATLLWHRYLGFGEAAEASQKHINTFATATGIGLFYVLLIRLDVPRWQRVFATLLVMASGSLITLAPSAHMKLLAFPFMTAALFVLVGWERAHQRGARLRGLVVGAGLIAVAAAFLASALATAPFAAFAVLLTRLRERAGWLRAMASASLFAGVCGTTFLLLACVGYTIFVHAEPSLLGLTGSVTGKADLRSPTYNLAASLARLVFGTANNLIEAPDLGSVARAWIAGDVSSLKPYVPMLLSQMGPWMVTLVLLLAVYLTAIWKSLHGARCLLPLAFLCGAQTWTIYWGLNDPEHWFLLTIPTVLLFLTLFPYRFIRTVLPPWAVLAALVNVIVCVAPYAAYPVKHYVTQMNSLFSKKDLLISFEAFSGGPSLRFIAPAGVPTLMLDTKLLASANAAVFFADVDRTITATLANHGRAVVFGGVLDPRDWNAPWSDLPSHGVTKRQMLDFFYTRYRVKLLGRLAEIPAWELFPLDDAVAATPADK